MNVIIYCRVSTKEQANHGFSLDGQQKRCTEYALKKSYSIDRVFIEKGESARSTNRTELQKMLKYISSNKNFIDALIIWKFDRLSRNFEDMFFLRNSLNKINVEIISATETNENSATGKLMRNVFSSFAQFETDINSERTRNGMKQVLLEGRMTGRPPLGYKNGRDDQNNKIIVQTEDAKFIKKALELFATGQYKQFEVVEIIKSLDYHKLSLKQFNKHIRNPFYAGLIHKPEWGINYHQGIHEPLISKDTYFKIQDIINGHKVKHLNRKADNPDFPLRGFVKCDKCNGKLTGSKSRSKLKKRYSYYHGSRGCKLRVRKEKLESDFISLLKSYEPRKDTLKLFNAILIDAWEDKNKYIEIEKKQLQKMFKALSEKKEKVDELVINGTFDSETYKIKSNQIIEEMVITETRLSSIDEYVKDELSELLIYCSDILFNISDFWQNADITTRKEFEYLLFPEGLYYKKTGTFRTPVTSCIINNLQLLASKKSPYASPSRYISNSLIIRDELHKLADMGRAWITLEP
jgi:site-specific DNA recombinase